jgi:arginine exporter protein ArgO
VTDALVSGLLAGYGVAIPVGAIAVLILSLAARLGLGVGAAAGLGVATADGLYAVVAVLGGAALARVIEPLATPLRVAAVVVLLGLAARISWTAWRHHREPARPAATRAGLSTPLRAFAGLLGLTLLNPATVVYYTALVVGQRAGGDLSGAAAAVFVAAAFTASASWQLLLAGGGSLLGRMLSAPRGRLATALVSSAVIVALALHLGGLY